MQRLLARPALMAFGLGLVSATGFAPLDLWPILLACFAAWLWLVHESPTIRAALWRSWAFGVGHFTVGNNWIQHAFDFQEKMSPALGYFAVVALALYLAIYPMLAGGLAWRFGRTSARPGGAFVMIAAAGWIVTEWLRATMFTGYAWNPLGVAWLPLIGVARLSAWVGTYALSGLIIVAAGSLLLLATRQWKLALPVTLWLIVAWGNGLLSAYRIEVAPANTPQVVIVQPDIGQDAVHQPGYDAHVLETLLDLTARETAKPTTASRLIVWPEGMVNYYIEDGYPPAWYYEASPTLIRNRIAQVIGPHDQALVGGTALIFGKDEELHDAGNSVFLLGPDGHLGPKRYDKAHLVPYGEYLPMRTLLGPLGLARLVMGEVDFRPGPGPQTLTIPGIGKAGVQICYEIIFSGQVVDQANRPAFLFNPSNDAWFGTWGPPQHLAQARMRAIEEGLPILRATPTGISALIDRDGRLLHTIPAGVSGVIAAPLPRPGPPTLFARIGNLMAFLIGAMLVAGSVAFRRFAR